LIGASAARARWKQKGETAAAAPPAAAVRSTCRRVAGQPPLLNTRVMSLTSLGRRSLQRPHRTYGYRHSYRNRAPFSPPRRAPPRLSPGALEVTGSKRRNKPCSGRLILKGAEGADGMRARLLIAPIALLAAAGGCRGPGYYAAKAPTEIAEMVQVHLADLGPSEAGYSAPTIAGARSYHLSGRKDLDSGRTTHVLSLEETASGEGRFRDWARSDAAARVCALSSARLAAGPEGSPAIPTTFELADQSSSCYPAEDCERYPEIHVEKYKDDDGQTRKRKVREWVQRCKDYWRCRSERIYRIAIDDRSLRGARYLPEGMSVELGWTCALWGEEAERLELPASYLDGYLLAVDGYPYAPR
jgi:hypothetical protein